MRFETERLIIRSFTTTDYGSWKEGYDNRLFPQNKFDVGKVEVHDKKYYYNFLTALCGYEREDKIYVFGAFDKFTGKNVGVLEIIVLLRNDFAWGTIGVSVHNQFWRKGFGLEIVCRGIEIAKDDLALRRLECAIETDNFASINLFQRLGFKFESVREKFAKVGNDYVDMQIYSKIL